MCMCVHVHRQTGCQAIVTTWQQPTAFHFWLCQALQLQKQALPEAPSFRLNRWDGWATSSDIHPPAFLVVHLPPCSPGQLDSYQRSWALFFQKANPTPVSRLYTGNRALCAVRVWMQWVQWQKSGRESMLLREETVGVYTRSRAKKKKKEIVCVALLYEDLRMDIWGTTRHCILFTGNGLSKSILGIDGVLFCRGSD